MADDGATNGETASVPLQPFSWAANGVGKGQTTLNGTTNKRKADGSLVPTGEDGCTTAKRPAADPAAVFSKVENTSDSMAVDGSDDDDWVPLTGVDENGDLIVDKELRELRAGLDENGDLIMDKELLEHLEWLKTIKIADLGDIPGIQFASDSDESEEEGEEVVSKVNTNS